MLPGLHFGLDDQVHFIWPLCAYIIFEAVVVCKHHYIFA
jgi:hypothetical protein